MERGVWRLSSSKKKLWFLGISFTLFIIVTIAGCYVLKDEEKLNSSPIDNSEESDWISSKDRINILLLGTDAAIGEQDKLRTDTIMLLSLDTKNKKISVLSIPRDTRMEIPSYGENKINAANQLGGVNLVKETISKFLEVPINFYVLTNFDGFKEIVDTLGGVKIDVEQDMKYRAYDGWIDIKKGVQRLDGEKALQYVRFRHDKLGDISRTQRQQKFLVALADEMMQVKSLLKLPVLIPKVIDVVQTDINIRQIISLANDFENYDISNITVKTLPGNFATIDGISYWYVDKEKSCQVVLNVFSGNSDDSIIDTSVKIKNNNQKKNSVSDKVYKEVTESNDPLIKNNVSKPLVQEDELEGPSNSASATQVDKIADKDNNLSNDQDTTEKNNILEQNSEEIGSDEDLEKQNSLDSITSGVDTPSESINQNNNSDVVENSDTTVQNLKDLVPEDESGGQNALDSEAQIDNTSSNDVRINDDLDILGDNDTSHFNVD